MEPVEGQIAEYVKAGMAPDEARLATLRTLGGLDQIKEQVRDTDRIRERYPDLDNADFRAWLDLSGTGWPLGEEVGEAVALLAEDCPRCSISRDGELYDWEIEDKRLGFARRLSSNDLRSAISGHRR